MCKHLYTFFGIAIILSMILTGCKPAASPTEPPIEKVVLNIMHNWGPDDIKGPVLQSIFDDFMKENPNITIKTEVFSDAEILTKVETAFTAELEPDIVFSNLMLSALDWTKNGVTVPVNDQLENWGLKDQFKVNAIKDFTDDQGRIQAFPLEGFSWPIWYNTKIFEAAGVDIPKTTDELLAAVPKIRAAGYEPWVTGGGDGNGYVLFVLMSQCMMSEAEAKQLFANGGWANNPRAVATVELFTQLRDAGAFATNVEGIQGPAMNQMFFEGIAAMLHQGSWSFEEPPKELQKDVIIGGMPLGPGSPYAQPCIYAAFTAKGVWITRNGAKKMDAVETFVKFLYKPENMAKFAEQAAMLSPIKDIPVDESKLNPLFVQSLTLSDVTIVTILDLVVPAKLDPEFQKVLKEAYIPGTPAEKILADLDKAYDVLK